MASEEQWGIRFTTRELDGLRCVGDLVTTIAGKTGTANKLVKGHYTNDTYASFVGFLPSNDPVVTILVVLTRVRTGSAARDAVVAVAWTAIAIAMDYVFMVVLLHPADGYYHADVLLYYALTLALPIAGGWWKRRRLEVPAR